MYVKDHLMMTMMMVPKWMMRDARSAMILSQLMMVEAVVVVVHVREVVVVVARVRVVVEPVDNRDMQNVYYPMDR